ncbi:MAG TPA: GNAT family N-acetyltransferase, partial [candidate division Zixibacteria bacterium]|nr:GNAT family N-acetyltransferase [candidate division Zixibacteria bacterium]
MQATRLTFFDISPAQQIEIDSLISGSFFASYNFMFLWRYMSGKAVYWIVEENNEIVAVLPAVEFGVGKLKRMQALSDGCYSSIFTKENAQAGRYKNELHKAVLSYGYQKLFIYDYYNSISKAEGYDILQCQTTLVDVSSPDWQPPDKKLQSEIRKAERENVLVEKFNKEKHFEQFIALMKQTEKRHNRSPKYSDTFFAALAELSESDNRIIWNWCEHKGKAVSSHINFIEKNQIINWQVYFDKQFSSLKANQKMLFDLAKTARDKNIQYLNLGASPIDTPTLLEYKNKW